MTKGADIIAAIILLALAIAIIVYLLHWLYRRSSKEVSFVRTGMLGEKVVISGGAFVLPIIHNITQVGMRTLSITIKRGGDKSLITKDRMRAELVTEFFTKVPPDPRAVSTAAQTLGNRTLDPEHLREVVQGRFADALGEVAAKMTLDEIQENRGAFVKQVGTIANESIGHTGLALETVSIISLDQTPIEQFNPANTFDSQVLTQLTEQIANRKKKRNNITQDTKISIENKNLETVQKELEIKKNEEQIIQQYITRIKMFPPLVQVEDKEGFAEAYLPALDQMNNIASVHSGRTHISYGDGMTLATEIQTGAITDYIATGFKDTNEFYDWYLSDVANIQAVLQPGQKQTEDFSIVDICKYFKKGEIFAYDIMVKKDELKKVLKRLEEFDC